MLRGVFRDVESGISKGHGYTRVILEGDCFEVVKGLKYASVSLSLLDIEMSLNDKNVTYTRQETSEKTKVSRNTNYWERPPLVVFY